MSIINITEIGQIPTEGKVVLFVAFDTAPCRKFLNYSRQAIGILEKNPTGASYLQISNTAEVKEKFRISAMPTCIVFVDGEEKKRFSGH